jgi:hypothetical protein
MTYVSASLARLGADFPAWSFRFDSAARSWTGSAAALRMDSREPGSGSVALTAETPDALAGLIRAARGQLLVVP